MRVHANHCMHGYSSYQRSLCFCFKSGYIVDKKNSCVVFQLFFEFSMLLLYVPWYYDRQRGYKKPMVERHQKERETDSVLLEEHRHNLHEIFFKGLVSGLVMLSPNLYYHHQVPLM